LTFELLGEAKLHIASKGYGGINAWGLPYPSLPGGKDLFKREIIETF
jgi:hypothetical protein